MPEPTSPPTPSAPWGRLAVTLLLVPAITMLPAIGLPTVDSTEIERIAGTTGNFDVFALGVMPFVSASYLVELLAAGVPRWRALRHGGPVGRTKLGRATFALAIVLCVFQGYGIAKLMESLAATEAIGSFSTPMVVLTMTAGTCLLGLVAELAGTWGLAGGLGVVVAWAPIVAALRLLAGHGGRQATRAWTPAQLTQLALVSTLVVAATWYVLRSRPTPPPSAPGSPSYRAAPGDEAPPPGEIPAPASGLAPLIVAPSLLMLPVSLLTLGLPVRGLVLAIEHKATFRAASLVLIAVLGACFTWMFNAPARVAALGARAGEGRSIDELEAAARLGVRAATLRAVAYLVGLFTLGHLAVRLFPPAIGASTLALVTAVALDLAAEWRARRATPDLVTVWPEHRPYALAAAREALGRAGIALHARGESQRRLLQFFGPYVPIDLMVPRGDAERATEILTKLLLPRTGDEPVEEPRAPARPAAKPAPLARAEKSAIAVTAALALGLLAMPSLAPSPSRGRAPLRGDALQILGVDDETDLFPTAPSSSPRGVSIAMENVPAGPGRSELRHYARIVVGEGEGLEQARARLVTWTATLPVPDGERVLLGEIAEYDDDKEVLEVVGWRTFLAKTAPVVDGADVSDGSVQVTRAERPGRSGAASVRVELRPAAAERFHAYTAAHVKRRLAIVVEGRVASAPLIQTAIAGGVVMITMGAGSLEKQIEDAKRLEDALHGP